MFKRSTRTDATRFLLRWIGGTGGSGLFGGSTFGGGLSVLLPVNCLDDLTRLSRDRWKQWYQP